MKVSGVLLLMVIISFASIAGCGGSPSSTSSTVSTPPPAPTSSDPWFGTAGNVLISDGGPGDQDGKVDFLWIGFNSPTEWQNFQANPNVPMMGGTVVSPAGNGLNFYFDPSTTTTAQTAVPEIQTTLDNLKKDPTQLNLSDHTHRWLIGVKVVQIK